MKLPHGEPLVLGLVGNAACGKDRTASILVEEGFVHYSTSEVVRDEIHKRGQTPSRELQTSIANQLRASEGGSHFVREALKRVAAISVNPSKIVLSGLYAVAEGRYIMDELQGELVSVVASTDPEVDFAIRYPRLINRSDGPRDDLTDQEFMEAFARENGSGLPGETNVAELINMSRFTLVNGADTSLSDLTLQVRDILKEVS